MSQNGTSDQRARRQPADALAAQPRLAPGARRALEIIFDGTQTRSEPALPEAARIAEQPAVYAAQATPPSCLLMLARRQGLDARALAARAGLPDDFVTWLDALRLAPEGIPPALVEALAAALGVARLEVVRALTGAVDGAVPGQTPGQGARRDALHGTLRAAIAEAVGTAPAQRALWHRALWQRALTSLAPTRTSRRERQSPIPRYNEV